MEPADALADCLLLVCTFLNAYGVFDRFECGLPVAFLKDEGEMALSEKL